MSELTLAAGVDWDRLGPTYVTAIQDTLYLSLIHI